MEKEQLDLEWQKLLYRLKGVFKTKLNLQGLLFLIGVQELGQGARDFTKEEKQDLMHIAVCTLLTQAGYNQLMGHDADGWPHFEMTSKERPQGLEEQEYFLKEQILNYFKSNEEE